MNLNDLVNNYLSLGYEIADAQSKVCQDLILYKIGKSKYAHNITVKGGVVMHNISKSARRATRDLDFDFIKYSLDDNSIKKFINELNAKDKEILIKFNDKIEKLHHQLYDGKRVNVSITDNFDNKKCYFPSWQNEKINNNAITFKHQNNYLCVRPNGGVYFSDPDLTLIKHALNYIGKLSFTNVDSKDFLVNLLYSLGATVIAEQEEMSYENN